MTNEEWDRKAEFLLNQQAKFDAGMQELKEAQAITERKIAKVSEAAERAVEVAEHALEGVSQLADLTAQLIDTMTAGFRSVFERMKHTDEKINVLVNSQIRTDESMRETDKRLWDTDNRLRALTELFERFIRGGNPGRNGAEN
jgi:hypothetical protein